MRWMAPLLMIVLWGWLSLPVWSALAVRWEQEPQYSHGPLVPFFACYLLWWRWEGWKGRISWFVPHWAGLGVLGFGLGLHLFGTAVFWESLSALALLITLAGLVLLIMGGPGLNWAFPGLVFLCWMIPLPYRWEVALTSPLQTWATSLGTLVIQTLGIPAYSRGHLILLQDAQLNVLEACSGLRMVISLMALFSGYALMSPRSVMERCFIVLLAPLIALVMNVVRVSATAALHTWVSHQAAAEFHDHWAVWALTPLALLILFGVLSVLDHLLVPVPSTQPSPILGPTSVISHAGQEPIPPSPAL